MPRAMIQPLTVAILDRMGADPDRREVPDGKLPGLYVRGDATGFPVFYVRKRIASGARPRVTLGQVINPIGRADRMLLDRRRFGQDRVVKGKVIYCSPLHCWCIG